MPSTVRSVVWVAAAIALTLLDLALVMTFATNLYATTALKRSRRVSATVTKNFEWTLLVCSMDNTQAKLCLLLQNLCRVQYTVVILG